MIRPVFISDKDYLLSTDELDFENQSFTLYPNPANNQITIEVIENGNHIVELFDFSGKRLFQKNMNNKKEVIDLSSFQNGIYLVSVRNETTVSNQKLIITH